MKKNKSYIIIILLFFIIIFGTVFSVNYLLKKIKSTSTETQELIADRENSISRLTDLPKIREQYESVEPRLFLLDEFFTQEDIVALVQDLERIAFETGNEISIEVKEDDRLGVAKKTEKEEEKLIAFPEEQIVEIIVNLVGEYEEIVSFIHKAKDIKYYCDISSIKMSVKRKDVTEPRVRRSTVFQEQQDEGGEGEEVVFEAVVDEDKVLIEADLEFVFYLENKKEAQKK